ncbi:hypothetical protein Tco_1031533 [Tanacetum coccineum]|uniref:Uncharacterized protein n=1 Tax=Tanacetum coccineum TaxID=301880 RepID=A0ABQ5GBI6_9ASTR
MVAHKPTAKRDEQKKTSFAADKPKKPTLVMKPAPAKQTKPMKEKSTKPSPLKKAGKGENVSNTMALKERIVELDEDQARSDHGNTLESRPLQDEDQAGSNPWQSSCAHAGPKTLIHETKTSLRYWYPQKKQGSGSDCSSFLIQDIHAGKSMICTHENLTITINENVKKAVQDALQAPVRKHFRELSKFEMKEILRDRIFESGSYRSLPEHTALYEALEQHVGK